MSYVSGCSPLPVTLHGTHLPSPVRTSSCSPTLKVLCVDTSGMDTFRSFVTGTLCTRMLPCCSSRSSYVSDSEPRAVTVALSHVPFAGPFSAIISTMSPTWCVAAEAWNLRSDDAGMVQGMSSWPAGIAGTCTQYVSLLGPSFRTRPRIHRPWWGLPFTLSSTSSPTLYWCVTSGVVVTFSCGFAGGESVTLSCPVRSVEERAAAARCCGGVPGARLPVAFS
mmetsp:Transcript_61196/g.178850  ORF Transcript_61196/g.178850 Transcript_61196/m.178850 type:complete len:222 (-) Transcript_61196:118-783(-)